LFENKITLAVRPMDRVQIGLMEDAPWGLAPWIGPILLELPDIASALERMPIEPCLQVGFWDGMLPLVTHVEPLSVSTSMSSWRPLPTLAVRHYLGTGGKTAARGVSQPRAEFGGRCWT